MDSALEIDRISKSYADRRVVDDVSFSVGRGEVFGLVGVG
jgi:ABC-2 type transport system ATP-binding protein